MSEELFIHVISGKSWLTLTDIEKDMILAEVNRVALAKAAEGNVAPVVVPDFKYEIERESEEWPEKYDSIAGVKYLLVFAMEVDR